MEYYDEPQVNTIDIKNSHSSGGHGPFILSQTSGSTPFAYDLNVLLVGKNTTYFAAWVSVL